MHKFSCHVHYALRYGIKTTNRKRIIPAHIYLDQNLLNYKSDVKKIPVNNMFSETKNKIVAMAQAEENLHDIGHGIKLWYRTWGNRSKGVPVLFVHGGPGNCVADYEGINEKFFDKDQFFVVEVDQRGTGNSQPSVRDDFRNMQLYLDVSISQMSADFELIREKLCIDRWLVFGGSWGSTLGLHYAQTYPSRCLGLIIRGIFMNTKEEFDAVYAEKSFENNAHRLREFKVFFEIAAAEAIKRKESPLDPNDSERFIRLYESMIINGNRDAMWRFHVFENNLVEEDHTKLLDPYVISEDVLPEAASVSFFESRLFLRGTFEEPLQLLEDVKLLKEGPVRTWVVQGTGDEVCPDKFARELVEKLKAEGIPHISHFVDAGHKASSNGVFIALQECVKDFLLTLIQK
jgi:proline iminopeptidase